MSNMINNNKQVGVSKRERAKKLIPPLLTVLFVVAISVGLFFFVRDPARIEELKNYGYLGAFLFSMIGNATILMPITVLPVLCAIGVIIYPATGLVGPIFVGLAGGAGAGIGEMTSYLLGYSGRGVIENRKIYSRMEGWMKRWGVIPIFINAMVPFFFDIAGMVAGALRFPLWKFVLACWLGRTLNYVGSVLLVAVWGWDVILRFFS